MGSWGYHPTHQTHVLLALNRAIDATFGVSNPLKKHIFTQPVS